jgi:hypothetical protein
MELEQHNDIALNAQVVQKECECHQWRGFVLNLS